MDCIHGDANAAPSAQLQSFDNPRKSVLSVKSLPAGRQAHANHGYEPQGKPWTRIPQQAAGYYTLRFAGLFD
jgi:hypothetical protein